MSNTTQSTATTAMWRRDINDLLANASDVMVERPIAAVHDLSAKQAARALMPMVGYVNMHFGQDAQQRACAELARAKIWDSRLSDDQATILLCVAATGLEHLSGAKNLRAALAFWATESDPTVWQSVLGL